MAACTTTISVGIRRPPATTIALTATTSQGERMTDITRVRACQRYWMVPSTIIWTMTTIPERSTSCIRRHRRVQLQPARWTSTGQPAPDLARQLLATMIERDEAQAAQALVVERACLAVSEQADWPEDEHGRTEQPELSRG